MVTSEGERLLTRWITIAAALLQPIFAAQTGSIQSVPQAGDAYEITRDSKSSWRSSEGSSGNSTDRDTIIERIVAVREAGVELEYDLPKNAAGKGRPGNWQFPARVFRPFHGPPQLLNGRELEARADSWLKAAGLSRAACGRWVFTWNAFRIECDPQSVIQMIEPFDLRSVDLRDGAPYQERGTRGPVPLRKTVGSGGTAFVAEMTIDPDAARRDLAQSDVAAAEINQETLTFDAALRARAREDISGTVVTAFDSDPAGQAHRRRKVTTLEIRGAGGRLETRTTTEIVERRAASQLDP
ncbi:hypothetical protein LZK98_20365 [Sphingomonas cannabina]|uniref:hypothetical protein n=1 Tax=Sphingomonas cannabina TaxID=2899123 RepID=UPI001F4838EB|nr:hypothetical protein [Sphingomonas cannabina]UIJ45363.1 hypothetical protein LZK98_20365 [Sphingomonas cannabina]